jgi:hypothetical protein
VLASHLTNTAALDELRLSRGGKKGRRPNWRTRDSSGRHRPGGRGARRRARRWPALICPRGVDVLSGRRAFVVGRDGLEWTGVPLAEPETNQRNSVNLNVAVINPATRTT